MTDLLSRLRGVARSGGGWTARCPGITINTAASAFTTVRVVGC